MATDADEADVAAEAVSEVTGVCRNGGRRAAALASMVAACSVASHSSCHADSGSSKAFVCNYHGWVFGQDGSLVDVPMEERCYHNDLDKSKLGLTQIRVETYKGFVFGCHDPEAPSLEEYLGDYCWYLDTIWDGPEGGLELLGPPLKSTLSCNWKVPTENFIGDGYHVGWTHAAALQMIGGELAGLSGNRADMPFDDLGLHFTMRHGHGFGLGAVGRPRRNLGLGAPTSDCAATESSP